MLLKCFVCSLGKNWRAAAERSPASLRVRPAAYGFIKGRVQQDEAVRVERGVRTLLRYEWPARPVGELHALVERRA